MISPNIFITRVWFIQECQIYYWIPCGPTWTNFHRRWSLCRYPWDTRTGVFAGLQKHIEFQPDIRTLVLPKLTRSPLPSTLHFQSIRLYWHSPSESEMMMRSAAYRYFQGCPVRNSWEKASRTVMYKFRRECWWTPAFTLTNLFTQITINTHSASDIFVYAPYEVHQPFPDWQRPCAVSCGRHGAFLVADAQWIRCRCY